LHAPITHVPDTQLADAFGNEQAIPQVPQWLTFEPRLISQPFAGTVSQLPKPALHVLSEHVLAVQTAEAFAYEHAVPHAPQLLTLFVRLVSHPFTGLLSQSPRPAEHVVVMQTPDEQPGAPPIPTQTFPHEPQLVTLVLMLVSQPSAAVPLQFPKPELHVEITQVPAEQPATAFANVQAVLQLPHRVGSVFRLASHPSADIALQSPYPEVHENPHVVPSHVAFEFVGTEQAVHDAPHVLTLELLAQAPPQLWYPALQEMPQLVPLQVAMPLLGTLHATHELPQLAVAESLTHAPPHRW